MDSTKVFFYEWSDINCQPKSFRTQEEFIEFCETSNINITKKNNNFLRNNKDVYATCKKGKNELIMSGDYRNFRKNFSKHRND